MNSSIQVIGLGELLWDCFPDHRLPGGAPANVAFHAQQLGLTTAVATRTGQDELGDEISEFLTSQGLSIDLVQRDTNRQTGTVSISPNLTASVDYSFLENSAWDFLEPQLALMDAVRACRALCFGTLAQRRAGTRSTIHKCLQAAPKNCLIVYDVNLRPPFYSKDCIEKSIEEASIVKLNDDEVQILAKLFEFQTLDEVRFCKGLLDKYRKLELVCVTRGDRGCLAVTCDETIEISGISIKVEDTVGAGDAFTAAIIYGRLENWPLPRMLELANRFGALVASRNGAMPSVRDELTSLKSELDWSFRATPAPS